MRPLTLLRPFTLMCAAVCLSVLGVGCSNGSEDVSGVLQSHRTVGGQLLPPAPTVVAPPLKAVVAYDPIMVAGEPNGTLVETAKAGWEGKAEGVASLAALFDVTKVVAERVNALEGGKELEQVLADAQTIGHVPKSAKVVISESFMGTKAQCSTGGVGFPCGWVDYTLLSNSTTSVPLLHSYLVKDKKGWQVSARSVCAILRSYHTPCLIGFP